MSRFASIIFISVVLFVLPSSAQIKAYISINTDIANDSFLYSNGFRYVEEVVSRSFSPVNMSDSAFVLKLKQIRNAKCKVVAANSFLPGHLKLVGPVINEAAILGYVDTVMKRAAAAGLRLVVLGSGAARQIPPGFDRDTAKKQFIVIVRKMAIVASKYKIPIAMENLNKGECNFINSVAEGLEIARAINHPYFKLTADIYHMLRENEPATSIVDARDYIIHCHIAENKERGYPGKSGEDFRPYLRALKTIGFTGVLSMECPWKNMQEEAPIAFKYLQQQLDEVYQ